MNKAAADFLSSVRKYRNIMIIIQGSPDPDAIASSFAVQTILRRLSIDSEIFITKKISLPQNRAFVRNLGISLKYVRSLQSGRFDSYIITDFQSIEISGISDHIPCAAHIDHHENAHGKVLPDFALIRTDSGSTSTLVALMLKHAGVELTADEMRAVSTALMFGIQTDTDSYEHAGSLDLEALNVISCSADMNVINRISGIPMSAETIACYNRALDNAFIYRDWGLYSIGYLDTAHRDSIAIVADILLKKSRHRTVVVYALIHDRENRELFLDASLRTGSMNLDLNSLIKRITPTGGGRIYKGAFQARLDYFRSIPDRDLLLKTVEMATADWIKKARDSEYLYEITGITRNIFRRIGGMLKNQ